MKEEYKSFIDLLDLIPVRLTHVRNCDKPRELTEEELREFLSLADSQGMMDACRILKPLYQKYKAGTHAGKRTMPELIVRGIYFVIFREMTAMYRTEQEGKGAVKKACYGKGA